MRIRVRWILVVLIALMLGVGYMGWTLTQANQRPTLTAVYTQTSPTVDGSEVNDAVWAQAPVFELVVSGNFAKDASTNGATAKLRAAYTNTDLYLFAEWPDPTVSMTRGGSWIWDSASNSWGHPSGQSEDRIALMWNMNVADFDTQGCATKCHGGPNLKAPTHPIDETHAICETCHGKDFSTENGAFFSQEGQRADSWHSKAARALPQLFLKVPGSDVAFLGYVDDKYFGYNADPTKYNLPDGGRYGDAGSSADYNNRSADKKTPFYIETNPTDYWDAMVITEHEINAGEAVAVADLTPQQLNDSWGKYALLKSPIPASYPTAIVPERILREPTGSRGDVRMGASWHDGVWKAEIRRKLVTGEADDVQFSDLTKAYPFDVALMDNTGGEGHSFHIGMPPVLVFQPKP